MSPTQPSEQRECQHAYMKLKGDKNCKSNGCECSDDCGRHSEPSPEQDWEKEFDTEYGSELTSQIIGIIAMTLLHARTTSHLSDASHITNKLRKIITTEKAKSYEAGQRDKVVEVRKELTGQVYPMDNKESLETRAWKQANNAQINFLINLPCLHLPPEESKK